MLRRDLVKLGAGLSLAGTVKLAKAAAPASSPPAATPFDDSTVKVIAQRMAKNSYKAPPQDLPSAINNLNFDQFRGSPSRKTVRYGTVRT